MFGLFGESTFLDADVEDWVFETWAWLMREFGGMAQMRWTKLALPTPQFFPATTAKDNDLAAFYLERLQGLMNMADAPCKAEPCAVSTASVTLESPHGRAIHFAASSEAAHANKVALINYDPDLLDNPMGLIAVLGHQLSRYRLSKASSTAPGGAEVMDLTADLAVAFAGLGVFNANVAYTFRASLGGNAGGSWSSSTIGYLSDEAWAFAIALFCAMKNVAPPLDYLKDPVADLTKDAARYLKRHSDKLDALKALP